MWRIIALALLLCAGCADTRSALKIPDPSFILETNEQFFALPGQNPDPPKAPNW